jgi:hypothetical protein
MNKKAYLKGYNSKPLTDAQGFVVLGYLAKEAGLEIPQEEVNTILDAPMDKVASEDNIHAALFLEGYTMCKEADEAMWNAIRTSGAPGFIADEIRNPRIPWGKVPWKDVMKMTGAPGYVGSFLMEPGDKKTDPNIFENAWNWMQNNPGKSALGAGAGLLAWNLLNRRKQQPQPYYGPYYG